MSHPRIFTLLDEEIPKLIKKHLLVKTLKPKNWEEEKQKFFDSKFTYNPQFEYRKNDHDRQADKDHIHLLLSKIPDTPIGLLYQLKLKELKNGINLYHYIGYNPEAFTRTAIKLFSEPRPSIVTMAKKVTQTHESPILTQSRNFLPREEIIRQIKFFLDLYHIPGKIITYKSARNTLSVRPISGQILVPEKFERGQNRINSLIGHEILTHMLKSYNGHKHEYQIFHFGTAQYTWTEEGLASIMGHVHQEKYILRRAALLIIAIHTSLHASFAQTFHTIHELIPDPHRAWNFTLRAKRGIADTSKPGAFTKDLYFQYAHDVAKQIIHEPQLLDYAFNGKASLMELRQFTLPQHHSLLTLEKIQKVYDNNFK